jgi:hypothetical protein
MINRIMLVGTVAFALFSLPSIALADQVTFHGTAVLNSNLGELTVQIFRLINEGSDDVDATLTMFERGVNLTAPAVGELHAGNLVDGFPATVTIPGHAFFQIFGAGAFGSCGDMPEYLACSTVYTTAAWENGAPVRAFIANVHYTIDMTAEEPAVLDTKINSITQIK